jgi:dihydrofolate reductase
MSPQSPIPLALIVAVAANGVIGRDNRLPWHIPGDLKWFKANTLGKPVIMGRKTWDSIGRPLPGRPNIVVTRQADWAATGAHAAHSLDQAISLAGVLMPDASEVMVIGGSALFAEALPRCTRLYLTEIARDYAGDTWFPPLDRQAWREVSRQTNAGDPDYDFVVLEKA